MTLNPILAQAFAPADVSPITPRVARSLPGIAKGLQVITGMAKQMPMQAMRGQQLMPQPSILAWPDPTRTTPNLIECAISDYLLSGNVVTYDTSYDAATGLPATSAWLPVERVAMTVDPLTHVVDYWWDGLQLDRERVCHLRRGADPAVPERGIGVVEQHLMQLGKFRDQETYESRILTNGSVPSVAVIAPNVDLSQAEADRAKESWVSKYGGAVREPAILPAGTVVMPLSWSPADSEMTEARRMSMLDQANILNLDGYWLGAPTGSSLTYQSPGPLWLTLLRQTVSPILVEFEALWGHRWLPAGVDLRFSRNAVLQDDMGTMVETATAAVKEGLWTPDEAREWMGMPSIPGAGGDHLRGSVLSPAEIAIMTQKIYLGAGPGKVMSTDEARDLLNRAGAGLTGPAPEPAAAPAVAVPAPSEEGTTR